MLRASDVPIDVETLFSLDKGVQHRYNHETCSAGKDTRSRLYVKNNGEGVLLHCFNCNDSGFVRNMGVPRIAPDKSYVQPHAKLGPGRTMLALQMYAKSVPVDVAIPADVFIWLSSYGVSMEMAKKWNVRWHDSDKALLFISPDESIMCARYLFSRTGRRWEFYYLNSTTTSKASLYIPEHSESSVLYIVEDCISAIRLASLGHSVMCLNGTSFSTTLVSEICSLQSKTIVLWLDNDFAGGLSTVQIAKLLRPLYKVVVPPIGTEQPKDYTDGELTHLCTTMI